LGSETRFFWPLGFPLGTHPPGGPYGLGKVLAGREPPWFLAPPCRGPISPGGFPGPFWKWPQPPLFGYKPFLIRECPPTAAPRTPLDGKKKVRSWEPPPLPGLPPHEYRFIPPLPAPKPQARAPMEGPPRTRGTQLKSQRPDSPWANASFWVFQLKRRLERFLQFL